MPDVPDLPTLTEFYKNPLTGVESTQDYLKLRPLALLISNQTSVIGKQYGISKADVIYEFLVEGGVTRLLALTYDYENVSLFGPIRSARDYALDIAMMHDAITVHAGGSLEAYLKISDEALDTIDGTNNEDAAEYFQYRSIGLPSYNSYMITGSKIVSAILNVKGVYNDANIRNFSSPYASSYFKFAEAGYFSGGTGTAKKVEITYLKPFLGDATNVTTLKYNAITGKYLKSVDGVAQIDALDDTQLAFENVLILKAATTRVTSTAVSIDFTSGGSGFYCNGGKYVTISWTYNETTGQIDITTSAGEPLEMATGKTFISVVSDGSGGINSQVEFN